MVLAEVGEPESSGLRPRSQRARVTRASTFDAAAGQISQKPAAKSVNGGEPIIHHVQRQYPHRGQQDREASNLTRHYVMSRSGHVQYLLPYVWLPPSIPSRPQLARSRRPATKPRIEVQDDPADRTRRPDGHRPLRGIAPDATEKALRQLAARRFRECMS